MIVVVMVNTMASLAPPGVLLGKILCLVMHSRLKAPTSVWLALLLVVYALCLNVSC